MPGTRQVRPGASWSAAIARLAASAASFAALSAPVSAGALGAGGVTGRVDAGAADAADVSTPDVVSGAGQRADAGPGSAADAGAEGPLGAGAPDSGAPIEPTPDAADERGAGEFELPPLPEDGGASVVAVDAQPPPVKPVAEEERPGVVIKTILGLVALLGLAYVGGHPRVQRWERALGVSQLITAGFAFVALGVLARLPGIGLLTDAVLSEIGPLLRIGLGWIGFIIGFRIDARVLEALPRGVAPIVVGRTAVSFIAIVGLSAALLIGSGGISRATFNDPVFLRDALILGTAGSLTGLVTPRLLAARGADSDSVAFVDHVVRLEELAGIVGLLVIAAYFRPREDATWQLPGTGWLLLTLGLGVTVGLVIYAILLRRTASSAESVVLLLGSVAFASGIAAKLRISPVVVCFVVGLLLANFPGHYKDQLGEALSRLERPIYLLFLLVVGALWDISDRRGWALMVAFVAARFLGKWLGTRVVEQREELRLDASARAALVVAPMGALSIAIVVNAQILYPGGSISSIVTAIVGGSIVTEVLVQLLTRGPASTTPPSRPAPGPAEPPPDTDQEQESGASVGRAEVDQAGGGER